jgi:hypothetical protein
VSSPTIKDIRAAAAARKQSRERRRKLLVGTTVAVLLLGAGIDPKLLVVGAIESGPTLVTLSLL